MVFSQAITTCTMRLNIEQIHADQRKQFLPKVVSAYQQQLFGWGDRACLYPAVRGGVGAGGAGDEALIFVFRFDVRLLVRQAAVPWFPVCWLSRLSKQVGRDQKMRHKHARA